ncbi:MAG: thioester domain-containing protein [Lachnospiraceae bacterium]|nr:thioester domain-containing protein [Lachnospiraceae bacterium]
MVKRFSKKVALGMCATVVAMNCIGVTEAFADTEKGSLTVTYQKSAKNKRGRDFDSAFNAASSSVQDSFAIISLKSCNGKDYTASYCLDYNKIATAKDKVTEGYNDVSNEEQVLVNYALVKGFSDTYTDPKSISVDDANLYYATQSLIWVITEGQFYNDKGRAKLEKKFGVDDETFKATYDKLYNEVKEAVELPEFAATDAKDADTIKLEWDDTANAYTTTLEKIGILKDAEVTDVPDGVDVTVEKDKINIKSTKELAKDDIKFTVKSQTKGKVVMWSNAAGHQPQATIDETEEVVDYDSFINVETSKKEAGATEIIEEEAPKAEPVATEEPKVEEKKEEVKPTEAPVVTEAPKADKGEEYVPNTGDEAPIKVIAAILGVSAVVGVVCLIVFKKKSM